MAADGMTVSGAHIGRLPSGYFKIVRLPGGGLVGAAGACIDIHQLFEWCQAGMPKDAAPTFVSAKSSDEDSVDWLWLKTDGSLWRGGPELRPYPVANPYTIGCYVAAYMVEGAMLAGLEPGPAIELVIPHCKHIGLPVQVEVL